MPFVLDNSVVSGWLLSNQANDYTEVIARRLRKDRAVAPHLLRLEYVNVLRAACRRQQMIAQQAQDAVDQLAKLPIDVDDEQPEPGLLLSLALRHDLSSYDAVYLELALRRKLPIATQDADLAQAARAAGVGTVSG